MPTFAIGNDLVHLPTFEMSLTEAFIGKVYTPNERADCERFHIPLIRYGSTWAAKEAAYKAIKQLLPDLRFWWPTLEISRSAADGHPTLLFHKRPQLQSSLSISHDGDYCQACCMVLA